MQNQNFQTLPVVKIILVVAAILVFSQPALAAGKKTAGETATVISLLQAPDVISPPLVKVKLGETIIWHNRAEGEVKIIFTTRIGIACAAPVNFYGDLLGNYETTKIPKGGTASICLIDVGKYEYEVRRLSKGEGGEMFEYVDKGTVVVEKK